MKLKQSNCDRENADAGIFSRRAGLKTCQKLLSQISRARAAIFAEARNAFKVQDQLLRLALNEAEALAWQTLYPQLMFPALATEKIRGLADWNSRQQRLGGPVRH